MIKWVAEVMRNIREDGAHHVSIRPRIVQSAKGRYEKARRWGRALDERRFWLSQRMRFVPLEIFLLAHGRLDVPIGASISHTKH